jgi:hypothetical protein
MLQNVLEMATRVINTEICCLAQVSNCREDHILRQRTLDEKL